MVLTLGFTVKTTLAVISEKSGWKPESCPWEKNKHAEAQTCSVCRQKYLGCLEKGRSYMCTEQRMENKTAKEKQQQQCWWAWVTGSIQLLQTRDLQVLFTWLSNYIYKDLMTFSGIWGDKVTLTVVKDIELILWDIYLRREDSLSWICLIVTDDLTGPSGPSVIMGDNELKENAAFSLLHQDLHC